MHSPNKVFTKSGADIKESTYLSRDLGSGSEKEKAYFFSQLSVILFERAVQESPNFAEDLDRVHSWFTKDLSDMQKLVCLRELLSLMTPSQHRFLFTSVAFESLQGAEDETRWIDLAMSDSSGSKENEGVEMASPTISNSNNNLGVSKLENLDLTLGESLFSGLKVPPNRLSLSFKLPGSCKTVSERAKFLLKVNPSLSATSTENRNTTPSVPPSGGLTSCDTNSGSFNDFDTFEPCKDLNFMNSTITTKNTNTNTTASSKYLVNLASLNAPPGLLSPTASEFRPSELSCHSDIFSSDFPQ